MRMKSQSKLRKRVQQLPRRRYLTSKRVSTSTRVHFKTVRWRRRQWLTKTWEASGTITSTSTSKSRPADHLSHYHLANSTQRHIFVAISALVTLNCINQKKRHLTKTLLITHFCGGTFKFIFPMIKNNFTINGQKFTIIQVTGMRQRMFEKQNNYTAGYPIRSRQYSQLEAPKEITPSREKAPKRQYNYYEPRTFENKINTYDQQHPYERPLRQTPQDQNYSHPNKPDGIGNYVRKRQQFTPKADYHEERPKFNLDSFNKQDTFADHSFGQNSFQNEPNSIPSNKRETAKRRGMEIKMTNIENINDKINNLLNMVKKDKIDRTSKEKINENSPKRVQLPSPTINRTNVLANFQVYQNRETNKSSNKSSNRVDSYKQNTKSNKRLKTYSALEQNRYDQYNPVRQFNEEDRRGSEMPLYSPSNYSPAKARQNRRQEYNYEKMSQDRYEYPQKMEQNYYNHSPSIDHYNKRGPDSIKQHQVKRPGNKYQEDATPKKYEKIDLQYEKITPDRVALPERRDRTPLKQPNQIQKPIDNFMPISLMQQENSQAARLLYDKNASGMKMVDNQIKKIKEKITESEYQYKRYQERLDAQAERTPANAGRIYTTDSTTPQKKFELKVQPVINDKPQTVKIAEKLCYQIEADSRMRKPRQFFNKIEGQEKWEDLEATLNKLGVRLTFLELRDLLQTTPDQFSPFDSVKGTEEDIVKPFIDSQKFWEKEVCGCASSKSLKKEGFNINDLDLTRKGYLSIEDLVCFVNLYTGHCYKNRDLAIVFRRLQLLEKSKKGVEIEFNTFFRAFTI